MAVPDSEPSVTMKEGFVIDLVMFAIIAAGSAYIVLLATA